MVEEFLKANPDMAYSPTEIGESIGYDNHRASSAVAPALFILVNRRMVKRMVPRGGRVEYQWIA